MNLTAERVREFLHYEPETGKMTWKLRARHWFKFAKDWKAWNKRFANANAFTCTLENGYRQGLIFGKGYSAHRVVWLIMMGKWPEGEIDHIDGNRANNIWSNLRDVSHSENMRNAKRRKDNAGATGVSWSKAMQKWRARITVNYKTIYLGAYETFEAACEMRSIAERNYLFHENHGRQQNSAGPK